MEREGEGTDKENENENECVVYVFVHATSVYLKHINISDTKFYAVGRESMHVL